MTERIPEVETIQQGSQEEVADAIESDLTLLGKITILEGVLDS